MFRKVNGRANQEPLADQRANSCHTCATKENLELNLHVRCAVWKKKVEKKTRTGNKT